MKTKFPILNISPTQWVLVDKTRIPARGETYCIPNDINGLITQRRIGANSDYKLNGAIPILAAYPKIEGVLLLPAILWEKKPRVSDNDLACEIVVRSATPGKRSIIDREMKKFAQGAKWMQERYEAAGGYTKEDILIFMNWLKHLDNGTTHCGIDGVESESIGFSPFDCFTDNLKSNEYLFDYWANNVNRSAPRALDIDVNEDGSMPSDNDTIIYNKAIY